MWIIKIGIPHDNRFWVTGYTITKKEAVNYLKSIGLNCFNKDKNHYYDNKNSEKGEWAKIEKIEKL
jgi:hypothetical protein